MSNKNFVVHNGLEVGPVRIFSGNGDIISSGNITSTSSGSTGTVAVTKYIMQLPDNLGSNTWYKIGVLSVVSGSGAGEALEIVVNSGQGYGTDAIVKDIINIRIRNGVSPNIEANYYSIGYKEGIKGVKCVSVNNIGTDTQWDVYVLVGVDLGKGFAQVNLTNDAQFTWVNSVAADPGSASSTILVASNKFVTATSNVVVTSGNLYVGGNIFTKGAIVSTTASTGFITVTLTGNGTIGPYNMTNAPADTDQVAVWWNGIYQPKSSYTINVAQITFTEAVPAGSLIEIKILAGTGIQSLGVLSDIDFSTSPTNGQFLSYNAATGKWRPATSSSDAQVKNTAIVYAVALGGF